MEHSVHRLFVCSLVGEKKAQRICEEELEKRNKRIKRDEQVNLRVLRMVKINTEGFGQWSKPEDK